MSFAWYGNQSELESRRIGSLAVIAPLLERMNVMGIINEHLPADPQAEFDYGTTLSLLIAPRSRLSNSLSASAGADSISINLLSWGIRAHEIMN